MKPLLVYSNAILRVQAFHKKPESNLLPEHVPLLTRIKPGAVRIKLADQQGEETLIYVSGGILEVQPNMVTVLADTAIRGHDLDDEPVPAMQQILDNPFLLLFVGIAMPTVLYIVWGVMEIVGIPISPLGK